MSSMNTPQVSIIINNYNYGRFLKEAIDSALNQTYGNTEVVVVDDESTDDSHTIIASYGDRIIPVLKQNGGQASALNAGVQASHGEIIIFLDADDYLFPQTVETVVAEWQPDTAQLQYRLELVDEHGKHIDYYPAMEIPFDSGDVWKLLLKKGRYRTTVTSGNSFSRTVLDQILPIPEADFRISADGYLVTVAPFYGPVVSLDVPLGARRKHGSNLWAFTGQGVQVEKLQKAVQHDLLRYKYLVQRATALGHPVAADPGLRDYVHLTSRIASLRLAPAAHPLPSDVGFVLAYKGFWAVWAHSRLPWKRKLIVSTWFLWVGVIPMALAQPAIAWLLTSQSRPAWIDWILKRIRALTR